MAESQVNTPPNPTPTATQLVYALTNVYSQFSFKLTVDGSRYKLWRRIFLDMCKGAKVLGHINGKSKPKDKNDEDWESIDSKVKSWFYSTCEPDLLQMISSDNCTAKDLWDKLDEFFLNNKMSRMLHLQDQFRNTSKGSSSITEFTHNLKNIADTLADVDSPITEVELVMQILQKLPPSYASIVNVITNTKPFPSFIEAKNMLLLHESRHESPIESSLESLNNTTTALYSTSTNNTRGKNKSNRGRNNGRGAPKGGGNVNASSTNNSFAGNGNSSTNHNAGNNQVYGNYMAQNQAHAAAAAQQPPPHGGQQFFRPPIAGGQPPPPSLGAFPNLQPPGFIPPQPSYYGNTSQQPTYTSQAPTYQSGQPTSQAFGGYATLGQPQFTDLASVFQAMSIQQPKDPNVYMDTGASAHMSFNQECNPQGVFSQIQSNMHEEDHGEQKSSSSSPDKHCRRFTLAEIKLATHDFDDAFVIGKGGFGKVYKGIIDFGEGIDVAIKRLNFDSNQGATEFWAEIEMLSKFRHSHIVSLLGYYEDLGKNEMILVYEYMPNGSLEDHLHKRRAVGSNSTQLTWVQRLQICIGAARGLDYLHTGTGVLRRVIHRDVKSSNILLDENFAAKISDFGLSRIGPAYQSGTTTNVYTDRVRGTFGYMDAEYFSTQRLTRKTDVYAFGVVLLEVLCGRPALDFTLEEQQHSLAGWGKQCIKEGQIDRTIDPCLRGQVSAKCLKEFGQIAYDCLLSCSKDRPTMTKVLARLEFVLALTLRSQQNVSEWEHIGRSTFIEKARSLLSIKAPIFGEGSFGKVFQIVFTRQKYFRKEQSELQCAHPNNKMFDDPTNVTELNQTPEEAKQRAEIARVRELCTLKGHTESVVRLKAMDLETNQQVYTV